MDIFKGSRLTFSLILLYEIGLYLWPGVHPAFFQKISLIFQDFLSEEFCGFADLGLLGSPSVSCSWNSLLFSKFSSYFWDIFSSRCSKLSNIKKKICEKNNSLFFPLFWFWRGKSISRKVWGFVPLIWHFAIMYFDI